MYKRQAQGVEIIRRDSPNKLRKTLARIEQLVEQYNIKKIVLGYPVTVSYTHLDVYKRQVSTICLTLETIVITEI